MRMSRTTADAARCTPRRAARFRTRTPILELLAAHGADLKAGGFKGQTALHEAALYNRAAVVECLLRHGLDVNAKSDAGKTPLDLAKAGKSKEAIDILLAHGAR